MQANELEIAEWHPLKITFLQMDGIVQFDNLWHVKHSLWTAVNISDNHINAEEQCSEQKDGIGPISLTE